MNLQPHRVDSTGPNKVLLKQNKRIIIRGGKPLFGKVRCDGAKNAVLKMMAAALLVEGVTVLKNVPNLTDVHMMANIIRHLGATVDVGEGEVRIDATHVNDYEAPYELVSQLRASFVVLGPLLARFHQAKVSLPGGCAIGERPYRFARTWSEAARC